MTEQIDTTQTMIDQSGGSTFHVNNVTYHAFTRPELDKLLILFKSQERENFMAISSTLGEQND